MIFTWKMKSSSWNAALEAIRLERNRRSPGLRFGHMAGGGLLILAAAGFYAWGASGSPDGWLARPEILGDESARLLSKNDAAGSAALTRRGLALRPLDAAAWCRLAAARARQPGADDMEVQMLIQRSYLASPIDIDAFAWRSAYIFDRWSQIRPELRRAATNEVRVLDRVWETKPQVGRVAAAVKDPDGRFALSLMRSP
jgi:hypothetical protein